MMSPVGFDFDQEEFDRQCAADLAAAFPEVAAAGGMAEALLPLVTAKAPGVRVWDDWSDSPHYGCQLHDDLRSVSISGDNADLLNEGRPPSYSVTLFERSHCIALARRSTLQATADLVARWCSPEPLGDLLADQSLDLNVLDEVEIYQRGEDALRDENWRTAFGRARRKNLRPITRCLYWAMTHSLLRRLFVFADSNTIHFYLNDHAPFTYLCPVIHFDGSKLLVLSADMKQKYQTRWPWLAVRKAAQWAPPLSTPTWIGSKNYRPDGVPDVPDPNPIVGRCQHCTPWLPPGVEYVRPGAHSH
jgi:hypothetical protein